MRFPIRSPWNPGKGIATTAHRGESPDAIARMLEPTHLPGFSKAI